MASKRKAWVMTPAKKTTIPFPDELKSELEAKANELVTTILKPRHIQPPPEDESFNYLIDIETKWHRHYFYFYSTYACPHPNAIKPTFESKFARIEYLGGEKFSLYYMRYTGKWVEIHDTLSLDESIEAIQDGPWFTP